MDKPNPYVIDEETARKIWRILVEFCGAFDDEDGREEMCFVMAMTKDVERSREYRFCGSLGFGGKFWVNADKWYVNCYREDENEEIVAKMRDANHKLAVLLAKHLASDPA